MAIPPYDTHRSIELSEPEDFLEHDEYDSADRHQIQAVFGRVLGSDKALTDLTDIFCDRPDFPSSMKIPRHNGSITFIKAWRLDRTDLPPLLTLSAQEMVLENGCIFDLLSSRNLSINDLPPNVLVQLFFELFRCNWCAYRLFEFRRLLPRDSGGRAFENICRSLADSRVCDVFFRENIRLYQFMFVWLQRFYSLPSGNDVDDNDCNYDRGPSPIAEFIKCNLRRMIPSSPHLTLGEAFEDCMWRWIRILFLFCETSFYSEAIDLGNELYQKLLISETQLTLKTRITLMYECLTMLLRSINAMTRYDKAVLDMFNEKAPKFLSQEFAREVPEACAASLYIELAMYNYSYCHYDMTLRNCLHALQELRKMPHIRVIADVLRVCGKVCNLKRQFVLGSRIFRFALNLLTSAEDCNNVTYVTLLLEYAGLLLSQDQTRLSVKTYLKAYQMILDLLPGHTLLAALALEDIAYSVYVMEYSSGRFEYALECANAAIAILEQLGCGDTHQASSVSRVKALILEEMAIDSGDEERKRTYLEESEELHLRSLELCRRTYGEKNMQTAKHYGNLGRLYQSMRRLEESERMHLEAIRIKEELLGSRDYEVGLSMGHLASLYNYDMQRFQDAEDLYLKSIDISLALFGPTYSGLEYDYRGLIRVYENLHRYSQRDRYAGIFRDWRESRQTAMANSPTEPMNFNDVLELTLDELIHEVTVSFQKMLPASSAVVCAASGDSASPEPNNEGLPNNRDCSRP